LCVKRKTNPYTSGSKSLGGGGVDWLGAFDWLLLFWAVLAYIFPEWRNRSKTNPKESTKVHLRNFTPPLHGLCFIPRVFEAIVNISTTDFNH
jgi:hypothetical protein